MPPGNTLLEAHKSSGKMIWTNRVRLKGFGTGKCRNQTREEIDKKLIAAGWVIQDKKRLNLHESLGVAVRVLINFMNIESKSAKRALTHLIREFIAAILLEKFTSIERLENEIEIQLLKVEKNKQSVLMSAFSGKV